VRTFFRGIDKLSTVKKEIKLLKIIKPSIIRKQKFTIPNSVRRFFTFQDKELKKVNEKLNIGCKYKNLCDNFYPKKNSYTILKNDKREKSIIHFV